MGDTWLLVDSICLRDMVADFRMSGCKIEDEPSSPLRVSHLGNCAEFVFAEMGRCALNLDIKCWQLRKVYDMAEKCRSVGDIHPFMMIWPPPFPAVKEYPASFAFYLISIVLYLRLPSFAIYF